MQKYGFVYIWFDRKHKRYYIGCRWGNENDSYVCSSTWMKRAYKHRPQDFKRRIIARVITTRKDLLEEEHQWLGMIKDSELGTRYYNLRNHFFGHWTTNEDKRLTIGNKISHSQRSNPDFGKWNIGKVRSEETRTLLRSLQSGENGSMYGKRGKDHPMHGRKWYNDGITSKHLIPGTQPEGWLPGRICSTKWYNNGAFETTYIPGTQPDGWYPGRSPK